MDNNNIINNNDLSNYNRVDTMQLHNTTEFNEEGCGLTKEFKVNEDSEEVDYFLQIFDEDLIKSLVDKCNENRNKELAKLTENENDVNKRKHETHWKDITINEMYLYFALNFLMPHCKKQVVTDYWKEDEFIETPIYSKIMSKNRFSRISQFLFYEEQGDDDKSLNKVQCFYDAIKNRFKSFLVPHQKLLIDESQTFRAYRPYNRLKSSKELYLMYDCKSSAIIDFTIIEDKNGFSKNNILGKTGAILEKLVTPYYGKGHLFYIDNLEPNVKWSEYLTVNNIGYAGTAKLYKNNNIFYNQGDQQVASMESLRTKMKFFRKLFFQLLDLSLSNSHKYLKFNTKSKLSLREFSLNCVKQLVKRNLINPTTIPQSQTKNYNESSIRPIANLDCTKHYLDHLPLNSSLKVPRLLCYVCNHTTKRAKKIKKVSTGCNTCKVALCMGQCFKDYHNKKF